MRPSQAFHVLETLRDNLSVPLFRKGVGLSADDTQTVLDVYQQWVLLMYDLEYLSPETLERDARRLLTDMVNRDVYDLNSAFAECLQSVRLQTSKGFKGLCSRVSTHLYHLIRDDIQHIETGDILAARRLIQCFSYTSRLSLHDIDLTQQMLEDYMGIEDTMSSEYPHVLIQPLNKIIQDWFGSYGPDFIYPQHGPGAVAGHGRCSLEEKYNDLSSDAIIEYAFGDPYWTSARNDRLLRRSETIFVPKSFKSFRTISKEPTTLQYFQQGVRKAIDRQIEYNHWNRRGRRGINPRYLATHIGMHDQSRNRKLALRGSIFRDFATIDLSSASDSVSYTLVKQLFRGTWMLRYIVATRSNETLLPDGRTIRLKKFAPMGSSLCFPIETIIFAAICEHVTRVHRVLGQYSVFGDDIVVPTQCAGPVMKILAHLGFHVNSDKSFVDDTCWFRESCGGEYCNGYDVTPMRVSRKYSHPDNSVRFEQLIALSNAAYLKGFRGLRMFFLAKLRELNFTVLFSDTSVYGDNYTNYHAPRRWNRDFQRIECRVSTLSTKYAERSLNHQDEQVRYRHWLESTAERKSLGDGFESITCKPTVLTKSAWRAAPTMSSDYDILVPQSGRGEYRPL